MMAMTHILQGPDNLPSLSLSLSLCFPSLPAHRLASSVNYLSILFSSESIKDKSAVYFKTYR